MKKTYELRTVKDFFKVPENKRQHCLEDFTSWLSIHESLAALFNDIEGVKGEHDMFRWIDDGKHDMHVGVAIVNKRSGEPEAVDAVDPAGEKVAE